MSRRKQARPRHVDDPDLDSPAIASNSVVPVFQEENEVNEDKVESATEDTENNLKEVSDTEETEGEDKIADEFLNIDQYKHHVNNCTEPEVVSYKHNSEMENGEASPMDLCKVNGMNSMNGISNDMPEESDVDKFDKFDRDPDKEVRSDIRVEQDEIPSYDDVNAGEDEVDAGVDDDNYDNQSDLDNMDDEYNKSIDDEDDNDLDSIKDDDDGHDHLKPETTPPDMPSYVQSLTNLLSGVTGNSNSNVMLEPIEATKAAVAQFAENNLPGKEQDVNKLQTTLYNLQQQQIMQLQLIHQLQQQLIAGGVQAGQIPALLNGQLPLGPNFAGLNLTTSALAGLKSKAAEASKSSSRSVTPDPDMDDSSPKDLDMKDSRPTTPHHSSDKLSPPVSDGPVDLMKPSPTLPMPSNLSMSASSAKSSLSSTPTSLPSSSLLDFSRSTPRSSSESQQRGYGNNDDPFFKHKCRICNKVFGSDSALQIHYRSHTGPPVHHPGMLVDLSMKLGAVLQSGPDVWTWEKPFQCNICGGRFSTRGNLKVHFQRHKQEFPNVEMNPNPVPEHLDKAPLPLLGSPFPTPMGPFGSPAFMGMQSLMNGFMFPPPHLAPRPPMSTPLMHQNGRPHDDRRSSRSPTRDSVPLELKKEISPAQHGSEAPMRPSPDTKDSAKIPSSHLPASVHMSKPSSALASIPLVSNYPVMSPLPSQPPFSQHHRAPVITPTSMPTKTDPFRTTILPSSILDNDDNLEQFMEIDKSETSKLQQLVDNIEHKLTDPNQCVICHRVLSCKSALQMHYRIHTGERPFRCKICGRSFTTKGNLKTHMGVHRAKPPLRMMHQCPVCHKQFTNLLVLQQHIRSHTEMSGMPLPGMGAPMGMYNPMAFDHHHGPLNMKRHYPDEYEKELDLSKKPRLSDSEEKNKRNSVSDDGEKPESVTDEFDEDEDQNEMDDEANKLAAEDAIKEGLARENSEERSSPDNSNEANHNKINNKDNIHKPESSLSFSGSLPLSSSPKYLQEDSNPSQDGTFNSYSTSLAALEERVRQIDSTMARNPLSQFHAAPFLLAPSYNGDRASSPKSESGSESGKDGHKPSTPALSTSSDGSMGGNFMIGAMDGRSSDINGKPTMCNICYKTFACKSALDIHYRSHTKERPYRCDLCDKSFTTRGNMKQHLLTHKINEDGSERSDFESNNNNSCTPNQNDNDSEKSNDSSQFEESHSDKSKGREHVSESQGKKEDNVSPVDKSSSSSSSNATAAVNRHSTSSYSSSDTQSPFISKTSTVKHQCLVCQKGFSSASALQIHIRTHTGDKPFKCSVCGKAFTTKGNLKVHMGTHMWNNSPSRRGRRMSIEPPFMLAHKENPYLPHGFPPRPDFYPFQFPPFMNGLPAPHKTLSEMSLMQNMSNGVSMKPDLTSPRSDITRNKAESSPSRDDKPKFAESGELDLSMKSTNSSGSRSSEKTSPSSVDSNSSSGMVSPPHMSLGWGWKASCHFCSRTFPTTAALEHHVRSMHMMGDSLPKVGAS